MTGPSCGVCGVEYIESYTGPCQEFAPHATDAQIIARNPPMCRGDVSWQNTVRRLSARVTELERQVSTKDHSLLERETAINELEIQLEETREYLAVSSRENGDTDGN